MHMGSCFSSETNDSVRHSTAKVISINGTLQEYSIPITVAQVLQQEINSCFVCNSDKLYFDEHIPALDLKEKLEVGQIYFILPNNRRQYPLTATDMAALAVKASLALQQGSKNKGRAKKIRISPVSDVNQEGFGDGDFDGYKRLNKVAVGTGFSRSGSVKKLQRSASRRAKLAIRSFRLRLSTIHEGTVTE